MDEPIPDEGNQQQAECGQEEYWNWLNDQAAQLEYQQYLELLNERIEHV